MTIKVTVQSIVCPHEEPKHHISSVGLGQNKRATALRLVEVRMCAYKEEIMCFILIK